jgi:hypothetical protein
MARTPASGRIPVSDRVAVSNRVATTGRLKQWIPGKDPFFWIQPQFSSSVGPSNIINKTDNLAGIGRGTTSTVGYTSAYYPTYGTTGSHGHADFNGVFNVMNFGGTADFSSQLDTKTYMTFFFVGTWDVLATVKNTIFGANVGFGAGGNYILLHGNVSNGTGILYGMRDSLTGKYGETANGVVTAGQRFLLTAWFDGSGTGNAGRMKIRFNGVEQALTFTGTIPATTMAAPAATTSIFVGTTALIASREYDGKLEFLQGYNVALDYTTEVPAMEAALNAYYSVY